MWKVLIWCAACLLVGSTAAAYGQTVTEPDSLQLTRAGEEARVRLYRVSGDRLRPARSPEWLSRDTLVALVHSSSGWVQAIAGGTTWLVATSRDGTDSAFVHVDLPVGPPPLLAPSTLLVQEVDTTGQVSVAWSPVDGAEAYQLNALGPPSVPSITMEMVDTSSTFQLAQLDTLYEAVVCVRGLRGDEAGPDACQQFGVPPAPLPPLEMPTGVQLIETVTQDTIFYTYTWDPVATADGYEWGAGPNDWQGGVVFRGPTWNEVLTQNLVTDFWQVRDLDDYTSWVCVRATRGAERSENRCRTMTVPQRPADSLRVYMLEAPPEQVYLGEMPADTLQPDSLAQLWGWDDETRLRMKAISLGLEFTLCSEVYWKDQVLMDRETSWQIIPQDGPADLVLMTTSPSPACHSFLINPDHAGTPAAQNLLTWLAQLEEGG